MKILGIDPGYSRFGWAVIEKNKKLNLLEFNCLDLGKDDKKKLLKISDLLDRLIAKYKPNYLITEKIFFSKNIKTAIKVAQVIGIVILKAQKNNLNLMEISPNEVKKYLTGWGFSSKEGIKKTLSLIFNLKKEDLKKIDDAFDALALAVVGESFIKFR